MKTEFKKVGTIHYAQWGEWGGERTCGGRYFTTDVKHTGLWENVTCKFCLKNRK